MEDDAEPTASSVHDIAQLIGQVINLIYSVSQVFWENSPFKSRIDDKC